MDLDDEELKATKNLKCNKIKYEYFRKQNKGKEVNKNDGIYQKHINK